jgi:hypothetical protein
MRGLQKTTDRKVISGAQSASANLTNLSCLIILRDALFLHFFFFFFFLIHFQIYYRIYTYIMSVLSST